MAEDDKKQNGSYQEVPLAEISKGDVAEQPPSEENKEQITAAIGPYGKWQLIKCIYLACIIWIGASFHLLNMVFYRAETDYWCAKPDALVDWTEEQWRNTSAPPGGEEHCFVYDVNYSELEPGQIIPSDTSQAPCTEWSYDRSFWKRTIIQEWDLVCDDKHLRKLTQQATFFGLLIGVIFAGLMSDRFGRIPSMLFLIGMNVAFGTANAFAPNYWFFLVGAWGCGFSAIGSGTVAYCWMMEMLGGKVKTFFGCMPHMNFAFWGLVTAGIAYCVPDWHKMQLIFSVPMLALLVSYWIMPESPRWLLSQGRLAEAEKILRRIAKFNGKPLSDDWKLQQISKPGEGAVKGKGILGFTELFKTPNLRKKTLIIYYMWFSTSLVYYGLTLNSNSQDSLFINYSLGKALEFPAIAIVLILLFTTGRRVAIFSLYLCCGFSLMLTMAIPSSYSDSDWPVMTLNLIGRACATGTLSLCYVISAEIYPTVVRNIGLGSSSFWARIGPMIAPYVSDLKQYNDRAHLAVFGLMALFAGILVTFLPETSDHKLPDTIEEGEELGKGDTLYSWVAGKCGAKKAKYAVKGKESNANGSVEA